MTIYNVPKRQMTEKRGQAVGRSVSLSGLAVCAFVGLFSSLGIPGLDPLTGAISGAILWVSLYVGVGLRINSKQEFAVVERLGEYYRVVYEGWYILCLPGIVDRVVERNTIRYQEFQLYTNEEEAKIDFADDAAIVIASAWFCIGNPTIEGDERTWWKALEEDVLRWTYAFENPYQRVEEILDGEVRPRLSRYKVDSALKERDKVAKKVIEDENIVAALRELGTYLEPNKGVIIRDIEVSEISEKLRRQRLEGKANADRTIARSKGYGDAINNIAETLGITTEEAIRLWEEQRSLEAFREVGVSEGGSRITFVSPNMGGVIGTLGLGDAVPKNTEGEKK